MERLDALAALVQDEHEQILAEWRRRILLAAPELSELDLPVLEDGVRNFLDELANALLEARDLGAAPKRIEYGPATHGLQRFDLGTKIEKLVFEYGILRQIILHAAERHHILLDGQPRIILHEVIDRAIARSVQEFSLAQDADHERRVQERMAMIVHDLKTPLSAIQTAITILDRRLPPELKDAVRTMIAIASRNCDSLNSMLMKLLERTSRDEMVLHSELHRGDCELNALVTEMIDRMKPIADKTGVSLINEVPATFSIHADAYLLKQVMQNLLSNALKFTRQGGEIRVGSMRRGDQVRIRVADTGIGMPPERVATLFERREVDPLRQGTGLGLAIVKRIVDAHHGQIEVQSEPGKGTRFEIILPQFGSA
jgi:signal transduction histidine kinase